MVVVDWDTFEGTIVFQRAFVYPSATHEALKHYQPMIALDAYHTKNQNFPSQLFTAFVLDGNMQIVILGYALAPIENIDN